MNTADAYRSSPYRVIRASAPVLAAPEAGAEWVTEAVLGEPARVTGSAGAWLRVVLPLQPSSLHPDGYPGWIPADALERSSIIPTVQIVSPCAPVRDAGGRAVARLPMGAAWAGAPEPSADGVRIRLADGSAGRVDAAYVASWPPPAAGRDLVLRTLAAWTDQPYVWGGTSSCSGADCSGLVLRTYQRAGIVVPRDAHDQFDMAPLRAEGALEDARPGDLVFFRRPRSAAIDHVGVYLGEGRYLSANQAVRGVSVDPALTEEHPYVGWARYTSTE